MLKTCFRVAAAAAFAFAMIAPAHGQATRTWVSGVGDDVNPCSRTAPCKTFAGAISKTAPGGEINCLDPGGFGTLTITKSITIDCTGTYGSTLNSGGINGFVINDSATVTPRTIRVVLRGLSINGAGSTQGLNGVRFISGASLVMEDVMIQNQTGAGVSITPSAGTAAVSMNNVTIANTGNASAGGGVVVSATGTGTVRLNMNRVQTSHTTGTPSSGVNVSSASSSGPVVAAINDSSFNGFAAGILATQGSVGAAVDIMVRDSEFSNNASFGVSAQGNVRIRVGGSSFTGNGTAAQAAGGAIVNSYSTNQSNGNTFNDGAFTALPPA